MLYNIYVIYTYIYIYVYIYVYIKLYTHICNGRHVRIPGGITEARAETEAGAIVFFQENLVRCLMVFCLKQSAVSMYKCLVRDIQCIDARRHIFVPFKQVFFHV